jgi:hypothetical protein
VDDTLTFKVQLCLDEFFSVRYMNVTYTNCLYLYSQTRKDFQPKALPFKMLCILNPKQLFKTRPGRVAVAAERSSLCAPPEAWKPSKGSRIWIGARKRSRHCCSRPVLTAKNHGKCMLLKVGECLYSRVHGQHAHGNSA